MEMETVSELTAETANGPFEPVLRPRVIERLRQAAARRITLVVAPAGFGKSVAIRQYLETDGVEHLRFSVRKEHDSLVGFLRGLVLALEPIAPKASKSVAGAYEKAARGANPVRDLATWVAALLARYTGTVVVDDLHFAAGDSRVLDLVCDVIALSETPWILAARSHLSLPYASWLAYGLLDELIDESVLALNHKEAGEIVRTSGHKSRNARVDALLEETSGWPAAFMFGMWSMRRTSAIAGSATINREALYNYLAHQVLAELSDIERDFIVETSVLSSLEPALLEAGGLADARLVLQSLRRRAAFISLEADGSYRYHDLFREFLEHELKCRGPLAHQIAIDRMGSACEKAGLMSDALNLYTRSGNLLAIVRVLESAGADIFATGNLQVIDLAIRALALESQTSAVLLLHARLKAAFGIDVEAERLFKLAGARASSIDEQALAAWRYSAHLARRLSFVAALDVVAKVPIARVVSPGSRALLAGIKASILSCLGDVESALVVLDEALLWAGETEDEMAKITVFSYAGFVNWKAQRFGAVLKMTTLSLQGAIRMGNQELAVITCTQLYNVALDLEDTTLADYALQTMLSSASSCGDLRMRGIALMNMCDRAAMKGDDVDLDRLISEVKAFRLSDPKTWSECVAPTHALRLAWNTEYDAALEALEEAPVNEFDSSQSALRFSELAFYAAASRESQLVDKAKKYLDSAELILKSGNVRKGARIRRARVIVAMTRGILFADAAGIDVLNHLGSPRQSSFPGGDLRKRIGDSLADGISLSDLVAEFESDEFEGWRRALSGALVKQRNSDVRNPLTKVEQDVARLILSGQTSREISLLLCRSILTIDTHARTIVRKMGAENRRMAVRKARESGWI